MSLKMNTISWLLEGSAWIQYRTRLDLLHQSEDYPQVKTARQAMLADPLIQGLISELSAWPVSVLTSHRSAGHALHKLVFLADLGLKAGDPGLESLIEKITSHRDPDGPFQVRVNVPVHFGGTGLDEWGWALCDAPLVAYALAKFGSANDERVKSAVSHLASLARSNGWPCAVSKELGKFRGPGRKDDPCPYATLLMLKLMSFYPELRDFSECANGAEALLSLWDNSLQSHPFMFYMGSDFRKLKAPLVWYDILHVLDVLSQFQFCRADPRWISMAALLKTNADEEGKYTAGSIWTSWKDWEFGQKKAPSRWITLLAARLME
jgi:hypothetical protein